MNPPGKPAFILGLFLLIFSCVPSLQAQAQPIQYYYDDLGRLVTMVDSSGNIVTYTYDAVGNILSIGRSTVTLGSLAIFDFNPHTGPPSTVVTIRGQGFSATASSDTVKFNGTVATVTSATTTSLVTTVPAGATTGPVSVTVKGKTATSSNKFVVTQVPVILTVSPKAALFSVVITGFTVTGSNLLGATFDFDPSGPTVSAVSINGNGTSATMTVSAGVVEGTFALVATTSAGSSGAGTTEANWFTVVNPNSTELSACGVPDVIEAAYGLDPNNPNSCLTGASVPLSGEVDGVLFSVLNTAGGKGSQEATIEADGIFFSVCNSGTGCSTSKPTQASAARNDASKKETAPPKQHDDGRQKLPRN